MRIEDSAGAPARIHGFPPIATARARILILGSMPGEASLRAYEYYAHPQNLFWKVVGEVLGYQGGIGTQGAGLREAPYAGKLRVLDSAGIALWDVLASCHRKGSLDSDIDPSSRVANDFAGFFAEHDRIVRVLFNGATAEACFRRHVASSLGEHAIHFVKLPSTSPANASIPYARKLAEWRAALSG
jgi:TDG/mug DNA glycosylase family protein